MNSDSQLRDRLLLGRYRVVHRLAEGGMGTVYLARTEGAEGFTRPVVIKRMRPEMRTLAEGARLFRREAEILSRLQHPNILSIVDFGVEDGAYLMVLDYVHGYSLMPWLDYRCKQERPLSVDVCIYIARQVLAALQYAHHFEDQQGKQIEIIHRDVSPDNVLLSQRAHVHLLDFGVASMHGETANNSTQSGTFRGKLGYAAPETLGGDRATAKSDQYSTGILLLEMLTFETPFMSDTMAGAVFRMMTEVPRPVSDYRPDIPAGLDEIIARAVSKTPADRFESVQKLSRQLRRLQHAGDDEVLQSLTDDLRVDFDALPEAVGVEPLKTREEALSRPVLGSEPGLATGSHEASVTPTLLDPSEVQPVSAGMPRERLLLLAAVGATALLAIALLLWSGRSKSDQQVLVVSGDNTSLPSGARLEGGAEHMAPGASPDVSEAGARSGPTTAKEHLGAALQQQSAAIESCFARFLSAGKDPPDVFLHFDVRRAGGRAVATVAPTAVAGTPLGKCLAEAGRQVIFPKLDEDVSFRVPVRARVSHWNDVK
jgi:serine/threonine protein kinase